MNHNEILPNELSKYYDYLLIQKQRSRHTAINYCLDINQYFNFIDTDAPITNTTIAVAKKYLSHLKLCKLSESSIYRKLVSLNQYWKYLIEQNQTQNNPWALLRKPRIKTKIPSFIESDTVFELLDNYPTDTPESIRNKCILELLFVTGIRVHECTQLNISDIDMHLMECRIKGKRQKERLVLFGKRCLDWLNHYLTSIYPLWANDQEPALFISKTGSRLTPRTLQRIVKDSNKYHSANVTLTPHACRHTCASLLMSNGVGIRDVQELLGHASISTTQRYANIPTKKLTQRFLDAMDG